MRIPKLELRRVPTEVCVNGRHRICMPFDAAQILGPLVRGLDIEVAIVLLLDGKRRPIGVVEVGRGGSNVVYVAPRDVFRLAVFVGATSLVLCHNHPSGDATPSEDDVVLTKRLQAAGTLVGIEVLDHLVIGDYAWFSFTSGRIFRDDLPPVGAIEPSVSPMPPQAQLVLPLGDR